MPEKSYFSKKTAQQAIAAAIIIVLLVGGMYYFLREEPLPLQDVKQAKNEQSDSADLLFKGSSIVEEQDGKKLWELSADTIETDINTKKVRLSNVSGIFYQENNGEANLAAKTALLNTVTKDIELTDQVKITAGTEAVLSAPKAIWNNEKRQFTASGGITLSRGDVVLTGQTLEASPNLERAVVKGNARIVKGAAKNAQ